MKTIKEAANNYAETRYSKKENPTADAYSAARNGFIAGVEFTKQWTRIEDELPNHYDKVLVNRKNSELFVCWYAGNGQFIFDFNNGRFSFYDVIQWKLIELK